MRQLLVLFLTISLFSCDQNTDTYKFEGDAVGFADGSEILVYAFQGKQPQIVDTIIINDEKFSTTYPNETGISLKFLRVENLNGSVLFFQKMKI